MASRSNKTHQPSKPCACCGRPMSWRRRWTKTWAEVRYCSRRCRSRRGCREAPA